MFLKNIFGPKNIKNFLRKIYQIQKIPHSLLFLGEEGSGNLAIALAFAKKIIYGNNLYNDDIGIIIPDIHFIFPIINNNKNNNFIYSSTIKWYEFIKKNPYGNILDWKNLLEIENEKLYINNIQIKELIKISSYKSYLSSSYNKIAIIWMPEYMTNSAASILINLLEDPPNNMFFFFVGEYEQKISNKIISRVQKLKFINNDNKIIEKFLIKQYKIDNNLAKSIAIEVNGNLNKALKIINNKKKYNLQFEKYFIIWMKSIFLIKKNEKYIIYILKLIEIIISWDKEYQKQFLIYCTYNFRKVFIKKYKNININNNFNWDKLAYYININNIKYLLKIIDLAIIHIDQNINIKLIIIDITQKIQKYLFYYNKNK